MQILDTLRKGAAAFFGSRVLWVILLCTLFCSLSVQLIVEERFVTLYDFDELGILHQRTRETELDALLAELGVTLGEYDEVEFSGPGRRMEITIDRAYPVYVTADGQTHKVYVTDTTVAQALEMCGVSLDANDTLNLQLDRPLSEGEEVEVTRIHYIDDFYTETIDYGITYQRTSLLRTGVHRAMKTGVDGEKMVFMREKYVNGHLVASYEESEITTKEPVNGLTLVGQAGYPVSPYEPFPGVITDENGKPLNYVEKHTDVRTTSYYTGTICASGLPAVKGHVGVDPDRFPYGTLLYIESADGSFVYGYCIAADTGGGIWWDLIDIDLRLDSYAECAMLGRRNDIVVYVLPGQWQW